MVMVDVGEDRGEVQTFSVHKEIICNYSDYFRAACTGEFLEAKSGRVRLPEDHAELFDLFVQWVYSQNLEQVLAQATRPLWTTLVELYILADKLRALTLKNTIMDRMLCKAHGALRYSRGREEFPSNADISLAYDNTPPPTSPMTKFFAELFSLKRAFISEEFTIEKDEVPKDYLYDLALALRLRWDGRYGLPSVMKELCRYHEHDSAEQPSCTKPDYIAG